MRILVVEDDEPLRALISRGLSEDGHVIDALPDGRECDAYLGSTPYDALVLDLNLPYEDGLSILRRLRARGDKTPVLLLTARDAADEVVAGLNAGADDYLRKPFAFIELEARLRSIARRAPGWSSDLLEAADLSFDCGTRQAKRGTRDVPLTAKESVFLEVLLRNRGRTVPRRVLEDLLWDRDSDPASNVLDVYARRLRNKLAIEGETQMISTVRGVGYRLDAP